MTWGTLLAYCLAKPGAWQDEPWEGDVVAKVGGKIFAFFGSGDTPSVGLKCGASRVEHAADRRRDPRRRAGRGDRRLLLGRGQQTAEERPSLTGRRDGLDRVAGGDFVT